MNTIIQFAAVGLLFLSSYSIEAGRKNLGKARLQSAGNKRAPLDDAGNHSTGHRSARRSSVASSDGSGSIALSGDEDTSREESPRRATPRGDDRSRDYAPSTPGRDDRTYGESAKSRREPTPPESRRSRASSSPQAPAELTRSARRRAKQKERTAALERELAAFKAAQKPATPGQKPPVKAEETPAPATAVVDHATATGDSAAGKGSSALAYDATKRVLVDGKEMSMEDAVRDHTDPDKPVTVDGKPVTMGELIALKSPPAAPTPTDATPPPPGKWQRFKKAATPQSWGGAATAVASAGGLAALGMAIESELQDADQNSALVKFNDRIQTLENK